MKKNRKQDNRAGEELRPDVHRQALIESIIALIQRAGERDLVVITQFISRLIK